MHDRREFFDRLYAECTGCIELRAIANGKPNGRHFVELVGHQDISDFCAYYQTHNIYFGVGTRDSSGSGGKENVVNIPALWADIDFKDIEPAEIKQRAVTFPYRPSALIGTGHGYHLYWILREPAERSEFQRIEDLLRRIRQHFDGDPAACEVARVLRVPGSTNVKKEPVAVKLHYLRDFAYSLDDFDELPEAKAPAMSTVKFTPPELPAWVDRCEFILFCKNHPARVAEPLWYACLSNLLTIRPGGAALCHEYSQGHPGYSRKETDAKILHAINYGPHTCAFIQEKGFTCSKNCRVKSPAGFGFTKQKQGEDYDFGF
jgi:hypothetical protein